MKIIDLLNKIANGEEVPKFWWNGCIHEVQKEYGTNKYSVFDTYCKKYKKIELEDLNEKIKFLEEEKKIPEKLTDILRFDDLIPPFNENMYKIWTQTIKNQNKINEIIDCLKSKGE